MSEINTNQTSIQETKPKKRSSFWENLSPEEREARRQRLREISRKFWNGMSKEEHENFVKYRESKLTDEQKQKRSERARKTMSTYIHSLSDDERRANGKRLSESWQAAYNSSPEVREKHLLQLAEARKSWHAQLTPEKRKEIGERVSTWWENLPDEEKQKFSERRTQQNYEWWASRTEEDRKRISERMVEFNKQLWGNMPMEKFIEIHRKRLNTSSYDNNLIKTFEDMFKKSVASNDFYLVPETPYNVERDVHFWDYGVYSKKDDKLVMVIDIDGAYNHADKCDYNGMQAREEGDEKRFHLIPPGVKMAIIYEGRLTKSFELMLQQLMLDYDEFIDQQFKLCRSISFPYPRYTDKELIDSWNSLCKMNCDDEYHQNMSLNTRIGDRLINHFHHSIYLAHRDNCPSPYEAWQNDDLLKKVIENRMIYVNQFNPNKILQGFNVCKLAPKVSVFSAAKAKMLINKYLSDAIEIFDPFSGFSGRMLGAIALNKKYIGSDLNGSHVKESNELISFLRSNDIKFSAEVNEADIEFINGTYDTLFTCPPYGTKEVWTNSNGDQLSCDEWIDVCLKQFKCRKYLFVVDKTEKYKDGIVDVIVNKSHFGINEEKVVLIER